MKVKGSFPCPTDEVVSFVVERLCPVFGKADAMMWADEMISFWRSHRFDVKRERNDDTAATSSGSDVKLARTEVEESDVKAEK